MIFFGKKLNINLTELSNLRNLQLLTLSNFIIDDKIIMLINSFANLSSLRLSSCKFKNKKPLHNSNLTSLTLHHLEDGNLPCCVLPQCFQVSGCEMLDLKFISSASNVRKLYLQGCEIINFANIDCFNNIEYINLDGSTVDDLQKLEELKARVKVSNRADNLPIL